MTAAAGWFPDPAGRPGHFRWWDGSGWTRALTTDRYAPDPAVRAEPTAHSTAPGQAGDRPATHRGTPDRDASIRPAQELAQESAQQPSAGHQPAGPQPRHRAGPMVAAGVQADRGPRPPGYERPPRAAPEPRTWKTALFAAGVGVLIVAVVGAILVYRSAHPKLLNPPPPQDGPTTSAASTPSASPTPSSAPSSTGPALTYHPASRKFSYDGLSLTMPGKPYATWKGWGKSALGEPGMGASATVESIPTRKGGDWIAVVDVGRVEPSLTGKTLDQTADKIISGWRQGAFSGVKVTIKNETKSTVTKNEPRPARIVNADFHYQVKGVKSSYDRVSLLVTKGKSGGYVAFLSSRPNRADAKIKKALRKSINTIALT